MKSIAIVGRAFLRQAQDRLSLASACRARRATLQVDCSVLRHAGEGGHSRFLMIRQKTLDINGRLSKYTRYIYTNMEVVGMFSTAQAAERIGVSKNTLLRWLDEGLTEDVERDWRGWRLWRLQNSVL